MRYGRIGCRFANNVINSFFSSISQDLPVFDFHCAAHLLSDDIDVVIEDVIFYRLLYTDAY